jgi:signal transduction histidine kinase
MFRHIFNNIISNAIKYSHESKKITIDVHQINHDKIQFDIEDQGIGIPAEDIQYLLEPFYRASNIGEIKGTGFGLSIVKRFVELHKGELTIKSELLKGTKITVILPFLKEEI